MNNKKIPTFIGLILALVLVVVLALTTSLVSRVTTFFSQASSSIVPDSVGVANISEKGFTVYWTSQSASLGSVSYGTTTALSSGIAIDDRNLTTPNEKYLSHFVRVTGLSSNTKYFYNVSGRDEAPLEVTTLAQAPQTSNVEPGFGKINDASGTVLSGAIVVLTYTGADKTATLSKSDGSYVLPVIMSTSGQAETVSFLYGTETATITCKVGQDRPLPTIKMGDNADCSKTVSPPPPVVIKTATPPAELILPVTSGTPSADIFHLACINEACVKITGTGADTCSVNKDCVPVVVVPPVVVTPPPATGALEDTFMLLGLGFLLIGLGFAPEVWRNYS